MSVPALLLAAAGAQAGPATAAATLLSWQLGTTLPVPPETAALKLALVDKQLVVVQAADDGSASPAVAAVRAVRAAAPVVRVLVVGPLGLDGKQHTVQRDALRAVAVQTKADFIDPVGSAWASRLASPSSDGGLAPADQQLLGQLLANASQGAAKARAEAAGIPAS
ncbi:MAG: hypothetical protein JWM64_2685 [Frankiales bacterium]|nr:hypothetical protein [Frankiales bacterium]